MLNRSTAVLLATASLFAIAGKASADEVKTHTPMEGSFYEKVQTDLVGKWKNELGFSAPLATSGPWVVKYNIAYVQTFPLKSKVIPNWTAGATLAYEFLGHPIVPGIYTKVKNNLQGLWQHETGFTVRTKVSGYSLVFNAGYLFDYPRDSHAAPKWQLGLAFNYPLHK